MMLLRSIFSLILVAFAVEGHTKVCAVSSSFAQMFSTKQRAKALTFPYELAFSVENSFPTKIYTQAGSDTELLNEVDKAIEDGCKVILGLYTSRECILVGPKLKQNKVVGVSPSCGHNRISHFFPNILTGVPKISVYSAKISKVINSYGKDAVYIFTQPSDLFSRESYSSLREGISRKYVEIKLGRDGSMLDQDKKVILKPNSLIVFTTYPLSTYGLLKTLAKEGQLTKDVDIIGSTSWVFDNELIIQLKPYFKRVGKVLVPDIWNPKSSKDMPAFKKIKEYYKGVPPMVTLYAYDTATASLQCFNKLKAKFSAESFFQCMKSLEFKGITGEFHYKNGPFPIKKVFLVDIFERM